MFSSEEKIIWHCEASNNFRSYRAEAIDIHAVRFALQIYNAPDFNSEAIAEVISVFQEETEIVAVIGEGYTTTGEVIRVRALEGNVSFSIEDSRYGIAIGQCIRHVEMN